MKNKSLVKNYLYNVTLTVLNLLFPLITFPYVTRVIGADGVGKVAFANSIVNYFILFACLGIPVYGVREVAKSREDSKKLSKVFSEIFVINFLTTIVFSIIYFISINNINVLSREKNLFILMGTLLILNVFNLDWLYQGVEEYKYITIRSLVFKIASVILLFLTVRSKENYIMYAATTVVALGGSNIVNGIMARKIVKFSLKELRFKKHIQPILYIFLMGLAINIYNNLDVTMLGIQAGDAAAGYYTAAVKINRMVISVITSLGVVLLPRLSLYIEEKKFNEFNVLINKSINFIYLFALPSCMGLFALTPNIIQVFSGAEFYPAISAMRINVPVIIFVSIANLTSMQILLPLKEEKKVLISVVAAAILNLVINFFFIPILKQNGAAIASASAEFIGAIIQVFYCRQYLKNKLFSLDKLIYLFGTILVGICCSIISHIISNDILVIIVSIIVSGIVYFGLMILVKEDVTIFALEKLKIKK